MDNHRNAEEFHEKLSSTNTIRDPTCSNRVHVSIQKAPLVSEKHQHGPGKKALLYVLITVIPLISKECVHQ